MYPELTALVGSRMPDYRGIFLRGHGSQTSTHYGTVAHTSADLGELQGDTIRNMYGDFGKIDDTMVPVSGPFIARSYPGWDIKSSTGSWNSKWLSFDASQVTPVADEIRPVNRSVMFLIRAK